jgi:RNA polymerase sigma-70 factor (ECF subfamily)
MDNSPLYTDNLEELWILALKGDADAFRDIHRALFKGLYNYALKLLQDGDLARDAVQDLFVKIWVRRDGIGTVQKIKPYFFTALRRQVLNQLRNLHHRELQIGGLPRPDIDFSPEEIVVRNEEYATLQNKIAALLNELPRRQKEVIYLRYFEEMDYTQIAEIMGIHYQSVLNLTQKALQKLRSANLLSMLFCLAVLYRLYAQGGKTFL